MRRLRDTTVLLTAILAVAAAPSCAGNEETGEDGGTADEAKKAVHYSRLAGSWYPGTKKELAEQVAGFLDGAEKKVAGRVCGLILPHAGYRYSGRVAAAGLAQLGKQAFDRVVVIGPSHRARLDDTVSVPAATHYATPLGEVPLDTDFIRALKSIPCVVSRPPVHAREHSVQIEVPLLQQALGDFRLVPVVTGDLSRKTAERLGKQLLGLMDDRTLVVASSDFTHYGPDFRYVPFTEDVEKNIRRLDMAAFDAIAGKDLAAWHAFLAKEKPTICGRHPIAVLMAMTGADNRFAMVRYDTSGRMMNNYTNSVSYLAAAVTGRFDPAVGEKIPSPPPAHEKEKKVKLGKETRRTLLKLARSTIRYYFDHKKKPTAADLGVAVTDEMKEIMGAFVTLKLADSGRLRGCIGEYPSGKPMYQVVIDKALSSAFDDPRFPPLSPGELEKLRIEISAIYPPRPVDSYEDIVIGTHGMILSKNGRRAVFLPQVAPEQGWDLAETLSHLSQKAGLSPDAWKEGAQFAIFEAEVFGEEAGE